MELSEDQLPALYTLSVCVRRCHALPWADAASSRCLHHETFSQPLSIQLKRLNSRGCIAQEHFEVSLVPLSGFRRRLESVRLSAESVVADGAGVAGTVRLATRLDPHKSIKQRSAGVRGRLRTGTETSIDNVAPVSPLKTATGVTGATSVHDGIVGHASVSEGSTEELDVELLVLGCVVRSVGIVGELSGCHVPLVPAGDVGGETTELGGGAGVGVGESELLSTGLEVLVPTEPAAVAGVEVHDDVGEVQRLERVGSALMVALGRVLAVLLVDVGDEVRQGVRLDDQGESLVGVGFEDVDND